MASTALTVFTVYRENINRQPQDNVIIIIIISFLLLLVFIVRYVVGAVLNA